MGSLISPLSVLTPEGTKCSLSICQYIGLSVHFSGCQLKSGSRDISKTIQGSLMNLLCEQVASADYVSFILLPYKIVVAMVTEIVKMFQNIWIQR